MLEFYPENAYEPWIWDYCCSSVIALSLIHGSIVKHSVAFNFECDGFYGNHAEVNLINREQPLNDSLGFVDWEPEQRLLAREQREEDGLLHL